jgi:hypothetical protein
VKAKLEEADMRLTEIKKEEYEFERDIAKGAVNPRTGKPISEKVIKYLDDRLRAKVTFLIQSADMSCAYMTFQSSVAAIL